MGLEDPRKTADQIRGKDSSWECGFNGNPKKKEALTWWRGLRLWGDREGIS